MPILHTENGIPSSKSRLGADGQTFDDVVGLGVENIRELKIETYSSISDTFHAIAVPAGERWTLKAAVLATDINRYMEMRVNPVLGNPAEYAILLSEPASSKIIYAPGVSLRLPPAGQIVFEMDGAGPMALNVLYEKEDIY